MVYYDFDNWREPPRSPSAGHAAACRCGWCIVQHSDRARAEREDALVEACMRAHADIERGEASAIPPFERALYERLTVRLMEAMKRACMSKPQMAIVVDEFISAARELADDAERATAKQKEIRDLDDDEWQGWPPPGLVGVDEQCACCQRQLGPHPVLVTEERAAWLRANTRCPGCIREGRALPSP